MTTSSGCFLGRIQRTRFCVLLPAIVLAFATLSNAQADKLPHDKRVQLENAISKFMAANSTPGIAAAVVSNGQAAWSEGFGMADLENSVPVTPQTLFRLASVSKPITATAAMQLWEQGKLDLDAPVQKYCPAFPQEYALGWGVSHVAGGPT